MFAVFTMFFNGGLIPNYVLINSLGFSNSIWAIVIPGAISIYNMLIMKPFLKICRRNWRKPRPLTD